MPKHLQVGSTYSNVTASRAIQTDYTNTGDTTRTVVVCLTSVDNNPIASAYVNSVAVGIQGVYNVNPNQVYITFTFPVPAGGVYSVFPNAGTWYLQSWYEYQ